MTHRSLRSLLLASTVLIMLASGAMIGTVAYRYATVAVAEVSSDLRREMTRRVIDHIRVRLEEATASLEEAAESLENGLFSTQDSEQIERVFLLEVTSNPSVTSMILGFEDGSMLGATEIGVPRIEGPGTPTQGPEPFGYVLKTDGPAPALFHKIPVDERGDAVGLTITVPGYDVRERSWYQAATKATPPSDTGALWSDIFALTTGDDMALPVSRWVNRPDGSRIALLSAHVFLSQLTPFLTHLHDDLPGLSFIIDQRGLLVANSLGESVIHRGMRDRGLSLKAARDSTSPLIAAAARMIATMDDALAPDGTRGALPATLSLNQDGDRYFVETTPLVLGRGLTWRVVTVVPESAYMAPLRIGNQRTVALIVASVLLMAGVMALVARHILRPLGELTESVRAVARGDYTRILDINRRDEIGELARSVNTMTLQLRHTQEALDRRLAEVSAAEARFDALFENAEIAIWNKDMSPLLVRFAQMRANGVTDLDAWLDAHPGAVRDLHDTMRVIHVNRATLTLFGAENETAFLENMDQILTKEVEGRIRDLLLAVWSGIGPFQGEISLRTLKGERLDVYVTLPVPHSIDGARSVPVTLLDVTGLRRTEERLRSNTLELERSNSDLDSFAYASAHDLREPLRNITSYTTLLSRRLADRLSDEEREFFSYVHGGALRMDDLVCDLLEFSRVGRAGDVPEPVALSEVVDAVRETFDEQLRACGGRLVFPPELPTVVGVRRDLDQLFSNLIANAIKYRSPEHAPVITLGARRDGPFWHLTLADNGIGLESGHGYEERIFRLFQRLHARSEHGGGTGIGLAICRKVVEHHGGRIWAVSPGPGLGTTFHFTLPLWPQS
ncbi:sensor histidine kinase [Pararhodospirillum oryzae]|uniref:histidine kinase n=1 Tax=Pararhodospirillum oryzae TaxID=478448 RepID=A0A512H3P6_9PROT|nr:ATP-binding protein [Pararhodospirillum oryzae]GEO80084.1 hypothetical protein ROR02_02150 [Pararhodospirillum oryzae]